MIWAWLVGSAVAGQLIVTTPDTLYWADTRTFSTTLLGQIAMGYEVGDVGFDPFSGRVAVAAWGYAGPDCIMDFDPTTGVWLCTAIPFGGGVAYDGNGLLALFPRGAEYFPVQDIFLGLFNGIVRMDELGNTWPVAPIPMGFGLTWFALAWDEDLKLVWLLNSSLGVNAVGLEPTTFTPVVYGVLPDGTLRATGAYDDTPNQTPILFVSGTCPGDLTVTIADATPGEAVRVVSSARPGRTTVPAGPCRGTRSDLANPQPRATLVADAFGLATTHVAATPAMCGRTLVQALDEGNCLVTDVVAVPATVVP